MVSALLLVFSHRTATTKPLPFPCHTPPTRKAPLPRPLPNACGIPIAPNQHATSRFHPSALYPCQAPSSIAIWQRLAHFAWWSLVRHQISPAQGQGWTG
ncbi:uncharacterized protein F5891DRAFT_993970 [Suillus fuscotomentosus]|uniref:Uncharacterized protein n=1 Tax=Suillus fuscotomentosus TaxID=1912939 RepID=A0AAD4HUG2_9AGAM|nr:uncharacterized protein F5891DRAFT_1082904 [Suillus fuscotomentosus]XP_041217148.1 uncharacterized protein F5891DRAFT_1075727 [Suillus fuscotomentosus]XP_041219100.1 uncharacterized protein F5891DRAFT_1066079 [Suillus fuscotomentosus]XP_041219996.1 uncharacterized protein F5891DRAFT_1062605 [Suillus fuscotomentosus]XP_041223117.1 uncharacterized protein F5891DRAFT_1047699 [Suillus fuscotomentosus]XP_041227922.1 uncharacterized protein F5891DRAFT_1023612 [Suillus fuscotomentosus]XP_04122868